MSALDTVLNFYEMSNTDMDTHLEENLHEMIGVVIDDISHAYRNGYAAKDAVASSHIGEFIEGFEKEIDDPFEKVFLLHMLAIIYNQPDGDDAYPFLMDVENYKRRIGVLKATFMGEMCDLLLEGNEPIQALYEALMNCWEYEQNDAGGIRLINHNNDEDVLE